MTLTEAQALAEPLLADMRPFCVTAEIAGSIRRKKADGIKDVEIVAVPLCIAVPDVDLFGEAQRTQRTNALHEWALRQQLVRWIKPGTGTVELWEPAPNGKYWRGQWPNGGKLDMFLATPANFGLILLLRTGPAAWSQQFVTHKSKGGWLPNHLKVEGGYLWDKDGVEIPTPTEESVFDAAGLVWMAPERRLG